MKSKRIFSIVVAVTLAALFANSVFADGGDPPSFIDVSANGTVSIDTAGLTFTSTYQAPPGNGNPGFNVSVPGTAISTCIGCLTFQMYITSDGDTVALPTGYTSAAISITGANPFGAPPDYALVPDSTGIGAAFNTLDAEWGISGQDIKNAYGNLYQNGLGFGPGTDLTGNLAQGSGGGFDPFAILKVNLALNNPSDKNFQGFGLTSGVFVFNKGDKPLEPNCGNQACSWKITPPFTKSPPNAAKLPPDKGEKDNVPFVKKPVVFALAPTSPPLVENLTVECPRNLTIEQADPGGTVRAWKIAPNFPVVVGQDPAKTGVTLGVSMSVPPVIVSYNVLTESSETSCEWGGFGFPGDNCDGKGSEWRTTTVITQVCTRVTETYVDRLANINVAMNLAQSSIDWITGELAAKYPGARVYQADWNLFPGTAGAGGFISDNVGFSYQWNALQTRDPGKYIVGVNGSTTGTQYTGPRGFSFSQETFSVDLIEVALTK